MLVIFAPKNGKFTKSHATNPFLAHLDCSGSVVAIFATFEDQNWAKNRNFQNLN